MKRPFLSIGVPCHDDRIVFKPGFLIRDATTGTFDEGIPNILQNTKIVAKVATNLITRLLFIQVSIELVKPI
ncbi:hypothetical protein [Dyadobacter sp. CY345]|uniref:hypothetical protein n=1 Tax=Dyadobacter sp. CY345 TaxID=2909335 RepID=UPI001F30AE7E|nr:hypothetical protein [Dyadobacter sp. CY345]